MSSVHHGYARLGIDHLQTHQPQQLPHTLTRSCPQSCYPAAHATASVYRDAQGILVQGNLNTAQLSSLFNKSSPLARAYYALCIIQVRKRLDMSMAKAMKCSPIKVSSKHQKRAIQAKFRSTTQRRSNRMEPRLEIVKLPIFR
jgi:hypothetical protein